MNKKQVVLRDRNQVIDADRRAPQSCDWPGSRRHLMSRHLILCSAAMLCAYTSADSAALPVRNESPPASIELFLRAPLEGRAEFDKASAYVERTFGFGADAEGQYTASRDKIVRLDDGYVLEGATMHKRTNSFSLAVSTTPCLLIDEVQEIMDTAASTYSSHFESYSVYSVRSEIHVSATAAAPDYKCTSSILVRVVGPSVKETPLFNGTMP